MSDAREQTSLALTPREIVGELDRHIVGQQKAKRAVAIALRNRWRRQQVPEHMRDEIAPKNIIMIGPTGCGKTEIARRLAKLAKAPFVKVEASKFTEVGYVGRDVESMIRDLVENAIAMVRTEQMEAVEARAEAAAEERLAKLIARPPRQETEQPPQPGARFGPFVLSGAGFSAQPEPSEPEVDEGTVAAIRHQLRQGLLDEQEVELDVAQSHNPFMTVFGANGPEELNLKDMLGNLPGMKGQTKRRKVKVKDARRIVKEQEAAKLVDTDQVNQLAIERVEQGGIVFLDEIDKVASRQSGGQGGPDVSREGVQRDLLPVVEGSTVSTKYGSVKTDHILFIAAGAFHLAKVSDLIPELQGRFPIRVELSPLTRDDFARILTEPKSSLIKQYTALLATEGITLSFEDSAVKALSDYAAEANEQAENIGARRLHTIMEALLEELSFTAPDKSESEVLIDDAFVRTTLSPILSDADLRQYIL